MKAIIVLLILIGLGVAAAYYLGGYSTLDPSQQGRDAMAAITPGMPWTQVATTAGRPKRYKPMIVKQKSDLGALQGGALVEPGPAMDFNEEIIARRIKENAMPHGFVFEYVFSAEVAFCVRFDAAGDVEDVEKLATMSTLLQRD